MKGRHLRNGLLILVATAMVLVGMCDSAAANTLGVQLAAGIAGRHVHRLDLGLVWNPGLN
jgi:lipid A 3-O-deacylase